MSGMFDPRAVCWRDRFASIRFRDDDRGIVTVQMVLFSIMLFGGVGLMMDFGRAYSAHSQMQGYIDQVALAAAEQLDGKSDAISRATAAANAVSKKSAFIKGDGAFQLKGLTFMTDAPTGEYGSFNLELANSYTTQTSELAKYVLAEATSSSVTVKLLRFAVQENGITDININAFAVATVRNVSCGGLTPLVMCNPYENSAATSWQEEISNGIGHRMKLTANDVNFGKPSNFEGGAWKHIRMGLLKRPDMLMNVRNTICTNLTNLPGASTTTSEEMRRDICMLATIEAGLSCVNDQVAYRAAHPEAITTGLGVVFDMYDDAMAEVVDPLQDFSFAHTFPASLGWSSSIQRSSLFYPDPVVGHGRMPREDFDLYLDNREFEINNTTYNAANPLLDNFIRSGHLANLANMRAAYGSDPAIQWSSRKNLPYASGERSEWGPAPVRTCLEVENCDTQQGSSHPTIYQSAPGNDEIKNYVASLYAPYLMQEVAASDPATYPDWWTVAGTQDATTLVDGHTTYYGFYSNVERTTPGLQAEKAVDGHHGNDGTGAWVHVDYQGDDDGDGQIEFDGDDILYGTEGTQISPRNYPSVYGALPSSAEERRLQRVTVVNCEAAQTYQTATGDTDPTFNDTYMGEVVDVVDLFMITPPQVTACDPVVSLDPDSNYLCDNAEVSEVHLDVELVDAASINSVNFDARNYAVLVH